LAFYGPKPLKTTQNPKNCPLFQNLIRCANRAISDEMAFILKNAPNQLAEAVAAGGPCGAVGGCARSGPQQTNSSQYASKPTFR
jgi:hypothetical protein